MWHRRLRQEFLVNKNGGGFGPRTVQYNSRLLKISKLTRAATVITGYLLFFFLLFHQLADDEALIIFLQASLFLVFPYSVDNCMPLSSKSSLTLSIHLFLCHPLLPPPLTFPCSAAFGSLFHSILSTCPNHASLLLN